MGNPQFIPAAWPVVLRTSQPVTSITREDGTTMASSPHVDLYLPNTAPTSIPESYEKINLYGSYLERELTAEDIKALTNDDAKAYPIRRTIDDDKQHVMVLGLPFSEAGNKAVYGTSDSQSQAYYAYNTADAVGFYTNKNWHRGYYEAGAEANGAATAADFNALTGAEKSLNANAHWATARLATSYQRNNKYVYNNKVFFVHEYATGGSVKPYTTSDTPFYALLFEDVIEVPEAEDPEHPIGIVSGVYDLSGRQIRTRESVLNGTWRRNLKPGVYIVNGRKMTVK